MTKSKLDEAREEAFDMNVGGALEDAIRISLNEKPGDIGAAAIQAYGEDTPSNRAKVQRFIDSRIALAKP